MDKLFFYIYGGLICLGIIFIAVLQYIGVSQNEIITVCMAGAGILSITSIGVIDKMFFGKWQSWEQAAILIQSNVWLHGW